MVSNKSNNINMKNFVVKISWKARDILDLQIEKIVLLTTALLGIRIPPEKNPSYLGKCPNLPFVGTFMMVMLNFDRPAQLMTLKFLMRQSM